ncbi:hypothetical protein GCM10011487_39140 [Steroidobacter agaridevorans]|uniref:Putative Flp pilus-assembly TadG-like N-terminal domain-containing protein n=1 Tax=Steroidobacter agaridevorans TaxID=2695856 RepID=A0A829YF73_9GAMM|nr:Tad domain-containing protein [Steroidobacter agaridevorans]GFE81914.1 hypothetical protein GCM10011487_39140 [Steroidobacter agaridevorans]
MQLHESPHAQRGIVAVLIAIAMSALILTAGLALDMGHAFLNKTRLQNTVDAAALAAAKTLADTGGNIAEAEAEAFDAFARNAAAAGNRELATSYGGGGGDLDVVVEFSATLPPFAPGAPNGPYVRVRATGFVMPAWLVSVGGIFEKTVSAAAVAGPRTLNAGSTVCNLAPMMVCGAPGAPGWGYENNAAVVLKNATPGGQSTVGPGNFQLIRLNGSGANIVRSNMAGSYSACLAGGTTIDTQPGGLVGPVAQGLNTRFGRYQGPVNATDYPPDVIVDGQSPEVTARPRVQGDLTQGYDVYQGNERIRPENIQQLLYDYQEYQQQLTDSANYDYQPITEGGTGAFGRRVVAVPIGDCSGTVGGSGSVPLLGFACFFLLQPVQVGGTVSNVFGQFVEDCMVNGTPGPDPVTTFGPQIIQLYDDPASNDS